MSIKATFKDRKGFEKTIVVPEMFPVYRIPEVPRFSDRWSAKSHVAYGEIAVHVIDFRLVDYHRNRLGEVVEAFYEED